MHCLNKLSVMILVLCGTLGVAGCGGDGRQSEAGDGGGDTAPLADSVAPEAPASVVATGSAARSVQLKWSAAVDNLGVTGYDILRDGQVIGSAAADTLSYTDTGLVAGVTYRYTVRARDAQGNLSPASAVISVSVRADADIQAPEPASGLQVLSTTETSVTLGWSAARDDVGVTGYEILRNGISIGFTDGSVLSFTDRGLNRTTVYAYAVRARDAAGNWSRASSGLQASPGTGPRADTQAPSMPPALKLEGVTPDSVSMGWGAASDNVAVSAYEVFRNGILRASVAGQTLSFTDTGLAAATPYQYALRARDAAGNVSSLTSPLAAKTLSASLPQDSRAPTAPSSLSATSVGTDSLSLSWLAATDDVGISGYDIFRDGARIASVGGSVLRYADSGLAPSTAYRYTVRARDAAGNLSPLSAALPITTAAIVVAPDTQAPTLPTALKASSSASSAVQLSWQAASDNVGVTGYEVFRDNASIASTSSLAYTDSGLQANTRYSYSVRARDAAGNWSGHTAAVSVTTQSLADTQAPSVPGSLSATAVTRDSITLSWAAATDNVAVTGYELKRNGSVIATAGPGSLSYTDTKLAAATSYSYTLRARDAAGNWSPNSATLPVVTKADVDAQAPSAPGSPTATAVTRDSIALSWSAATDNVGVTGYEVFRGSTAIGTTAAATRSFTDTGLAASTPYTYQVRARDAAGNWSAKSGSLNVSTASSGADSLSPPHSANVPAGYRLVWNDEFSGSGLPDSSKWIYDDWGNVNGWGNQELQYYGVADLDNTQLSNGKLFITARKETVVSGTGHVFNYTSARLTTYGKADWNYGYFEVRAKMPCGAGTWPAIWTLGSTGWWPAGGEIDILEHFQGTHTLAAANVHWEENGTHREVSPQYRDVSTICSDFHNYWLKWTADAIVIGVDGDTMLSVSKQAIAEGRWPFDNRQFLLLNLAVGGFGGGPVDDSIFPRSMVVDYVRVYQTP